MTSPRPLHQTRDAGGLVYEIWDGRDVAGGDVDRMCQVLGEAFDTWPAFELPVDLGRTEHLRWKLERGYPHIVRDGEQVVGLSVSVPLTFLADREPVRVLLGCDSGVLASYQGRGINHTRQAFVRQQLDAATDIELTYSTNPIIIRQDRRRGRRELGNPPVAHFLPLDDRRVAEELAARRGSSLPQGWRLLLAAQRVRSKLGPRWRPLSTGDWAVTPVDRFDDRFDEISSAAPSSRSD